MTNILELLKNEKVEWKKLGEVCEIKNGKNINKQIIENNKGNYPVINSGKEPLGYYNQYNTEDDPIGITSRGAGVGSITYQEGKYFRGNLNYTVTIKNKKYLNTKFLYHLLIEHQENIKKLATFQGIPALNASSLKELEIPITSIDIQEKIVEILDKFTGYVTELQSELQSRTKQYTYYRDMLLSEEYLNKITKEMEEDRRLTVYSLDEIFEFKNGLNKGKEYFGKGNPFVSYVNVYKLDRLFEEDITEKVEVTENEIERFSVKKGDVLFTRTSEVKEEVGFSTVILSELDNCVFNGFTIRARPKKDNLLIPSYCAHLFRSYEVRKEIIKRSSFTTRASLSGQELGKVKIVIPPVAIQNKIVKVLDKFQALLEDTKGLLPKEIEQRQKQYEYWREQLLSFSK